MAHRRALVYLGVALLVVFGVLLPGSITNRASAHNLGWYLVRNGQLRYYDATGSISKFGNLIRTAEDPWQPYVDINIREVFNRSDADVTLVGFCGPNTDLVGITYAPTGSSSARTTKFNRCLLNHKGGFVRNDQGRESKTKKRATTASRRQRTFVHEFGHAFGLDHTPELLHTDAVMSDIYRFVGPGNSGVLLPNNSVTIYRPTTHDIRGAQNRWP